MDHLLTRVYVYVTPNGLYPFLSRIEYSYFKLIIYSVDVQVMFTSGSVHPIDVPTQITDR